MKQKTFYVNIDVTASLSVVVKAADLEEAIAKGHKLGEKPGDLYRTKRPVDGINWDEAKVTGVCE